MGRRSHGTPDVLLDFDMPAVDSGTTYTTSNQASTDSIDLESASAEVGTGKPIYVKVHVGDTAVTQTGTLIVSIQDSADNSTFANTEIVSAGRRSNVSSARAIRGDELSKNASARPASPTSSGGYWLVGRSIQANTIRTNANTHRRTPWESTFR